MQDSANTRKKQKRKKLRLKRATKKFYAIKRKKKETKVKTRRPNDLDFI